MTSSFFHPPLELATLRSLEIVRQLMIEHPAYFLDSPYAGETERLIRGWFDAKAVKARHMEQLADAEEGDNPATLEDDKWLYIYNETSALYRSLKVAKHGDEEDQMAYFRTATALLEKMISMQERALGLKQVSEFNATVMTIMESILSPTQRNEVMDQLKNALSN